MFVFSSAFCVGGKDMNTRIFGAKHYSNLIVYSLGGHTDSIVNAFFERDSLDVSFTSGCHRRLTTYLVVYLSLLIHRPAC